MRIRQILLRQYRAIYRVFKRRVGILIIVDGRRYMQTLRDRWLLGRPHSLSRRQIKP